MNASFRSSQNLGSPQLVHDAIFKLIRPYLSQSQISALQFHIGLSKSKRALVKIQHKGILYQFHCGCNSKDILAIAKYQILKKSLLQQKRFVRLSEDDRAGKRKVQQLLSSRSNQIRALKSLTPLNQAGLKQRLKDILQILKVQDQFQNYGLNLMLAQNINFSFKKLSLRTFVFRPRGRFVGLKDFLIIRPLGIGGFSKVYLVRSKFNGNFYALKLMNKQELKLNRMNIAINQKEALLAVDSSFIAKLHFSFETKTYLALVLDYCPGGQLFYQLRKVRRMSQQDARFYFVQILAGLQVLHKNRIIYRDLKPENLLLDAFGHVKIADFGLSKLNAEEFMPNYTFCGSAEYMCPQMILNEGHSYQLDFYSIGALLYELVCGLPPFYSLDQEVLKRSIIFDQLKFPQNVQLTQQIKQLLQKLLCKYANRRLGSFKGVKQIMLHPWIGYFDSKKVRQRQLKPPFIPNLLQFNFDEEQLGKDWKQSLSRVLKQQKRQEMFKAQFKQFYYQKKDAKSQWLFQALLQLSQSKLNKSRLARSVSPQIQRLTLQIHINRSINFQKDNQSKRLKRLKRNQSRGKITLAPIKIQKPII